MKDEDFETRSDGHLYLKTDSDKAWPVCPICKGEGMDWDYGLKDVRPCRRCFGRGRIKPDETK